MDVYDRIDVLLKEKGVSRRKAAQIAGIVPGTLNSALYRKKGLSAAAVSDLAKALGVDANYLLYGQTTEESIQQYREGATERHQKNRMEARATNEYYESLGYSFNVRGDDYVITEPDGTEIAMDFMRDMPFYASQVSDSLKEDAELIHKRAVKKVIKKATEQQDR